MAPAQKKMCLLKMSYVFSNKKKYFHIEVVASDGIAKHSKL